MPATRVRPGDVVLRALLRAPMHIGGLYQEYVEAVHEDDAFRKPMSSGSFYQWFRKARSLGLVTEVGRAPLEGVTEAQAAWIDGHREDLRFVERDGQKFSAPPSERIIFAAVGGREADPAWNNVTAAYRVRWVGNGQEAASQEAQEGAVEEPPGPKPRRSARSKPREPAKAVPAQKERVRLALPPLPTMGDMPPAAEAPAVQRMATFLRQLAAYPQHTQSWEDSVGESYAVLARWSSALAQRIDILESRKLTANAARAERLLEVVDAAAEALESMDPGQAAQELARLFAPA